MDWSLSLQIFLYLQVLDVLTTFLGFRLGLSEASGQQIVQRLQKFGPGLLEESGLAIKRQEGGFYDRFRARLMFPIHHA